MQNRDPRSRIEIPDIRHWYRDAGKGIPFAFEAHRDDRHGQHIQRLTYTSRTTLAADTGPRFYPGFGGRLVNARANVDGAPSGTAFQCDVLLSGNSVFGSNSGYLEIAAGSVYGYKKPVDRRIYFLPDEYFQVKVVTVSSATGPLVVDLEYIPG